MNGLYGQVVQELGQVAEALDHRAVQHSCEMIVGAGRIVIYGCGREGLQLQGLAMRLHQLGLDAAMQGDMTTPP